jgi:protein-S-isoprenylcysteine O-methyltransferase Ste14
MTNLPSLGPRGEGWVAIQILFFAALVAAATVFVDTITLPAGLGPFVEGAGGALIAAGAVLGGAAILHLGEAGSLTALPHPRGEATLVVHGAYRLVRHPIYGGLVIAALGLALVRRSWPTLVIAFALLVFFALKARREEVWLAARYPGYGAYRRRTRALIPFVL